MTLPKQQSLEDFTMNNGYFFFVYCGILCRSVVICEKDLRTSDLWQHFYITFSSKIKCRSISHVDVSKFRIAKWLSALQSAVYCLHILTLF